MSNRARRAHTHGLRRRLLPRPSNLLAVTITVSGASRAARAAAALASKTKGLANPRHHAGP
jgi:hypothetical protein